MNYSFSDAAVVQGQAHIREGIVCQDFGLSKQTPNFSLAVISDGCSSSGRTDVGARLLAYAAQKAFMLDDLVFLKPNVLLEKILDYSQESMNALGCEITDMDATLGIVLGVQDQAYVWLWGDGVIAAREENGIRIWNAQWTGSLPGYPFYLLNKARQELFIEQSNNFAKSLSQPSYCVTEYFLQENILQEISREEKDAVQGLEGLSKNIRAADVVAVMSDGVLQFADLEMDVVVQEMMQVKQALYGTFISRRLKRALNKFSKTNVFPQDDFSIAAIAKPVFYQNV